MLRGRRRRRTSVSLTILRSSSWESCRCSSPHISSFLEGDEQAAYPHAAVLVVLLWLPLLHSSSLCQFSGQCYLGDGSSTQRAQCFKRSVSLKYFICFSLIGTCRKTSQCIVWRKASKCHRWFPWNSILLLPCYFVSKTKTVEYTNRLSKCI